ncbi:TIGR03084 family metal-binding protein [Hyphomonas sp.]|uniref:TIGR03084 family metal-binding protein n=1 Tax=Hyphomonas sp. TaxID=87 RepID=UPI000C4F45F5|nr:TIGR03084 family metal-binding protein [Hyphomonas sp.]MAB10055.1 TIGR03084 family protein [Hyphomonas sp.]MAU66857.1 TIGR03084 family protein [Hyphomonas sp.]MBM58106.1 TIGR03084 family protein [Hyphomonas sp.]
MEQAGDFLEESRALYGLLVNRPDADFGKVTQFKGWQIDDVLRHLHYWNWMAELQLADEARLETELAAVGKHGMRNREQAHAGDAAGRDLLSAWWDQAQATAAAFTKADPKARLKWAGPSMSARSSITARLMETWAHGQEIYDVLGAARVDHDRIRNIVVLGVNTYGWTYQVRQEQPPGPMPFIRLIAPSGDEWTFGDDDGENLIEGRATEFCQVVTQTRNVKDTALRVTGPIAEDWMSKAQCFAGGRNDPPAPGTRFRSPVTA